MSLWESVAELQLKVDGYKSVVREVPADQLPELADDIATPQDLLSQLSTIALTGDAAEAVAGVQSSFGDYTDAISAYSRALGTILRRDDYAQRRVFSCFLVVDPSRVRLPDRAF